MIVGGESGPGARSMDPEWPRRIRELCLAAGTPFFFKQWDGPRPQSNGRTLDGVVHEAYPSAPSRPG